MLAAYVEEARINTLSELSAKTLTLSNLFPETIFRCGSSYTREDFHGSVFSNEIHAIKEKLPPDRSLENRSQRFSELAISLKECNLADGKVTLLHIGDGVNKLALRALINRKLKGTNIDVKFMVVDPYEELLPDAQGGYRSTFADWKDLAIELRDFIDTLKENDLVLVTVSLDQTLLFPETKETAKLSKFLRRSLERYISNFSSSTVRTMSTESAIEIVKTKYDPFIVPTSNFVQDYDVLAFAVLTLVSGISSAEEIDTYTDFTGKHFRDVKQRISKGRWGLRELLSTNPLERRFDSTHQFWLVDKLSDMMTVSEQLIKEGLSFNHPFRLAQNEIMCDYITDKVPLINEILLREIEYILTSHKNSLIIGFSDMPLNSFGLETCNEGHVKPISDRKSTFFLEIPN